MLYTKFQGHRPLGSEEVDFTIYGPGSHLEQIFTNFDKYMHQKCGIFCQKLGFIMTSINL